MALPTDCLEVGTIPGQIRPQIERNNVVYLVGLGNKAGLATWTYIVDSGPKIASDAVPSVWFVRFHNFAP